MQCGFTKNNGGQCEAQATRGGEFCYFHDPSIPEEVKQEGRTKGGLTRAIKLDSPLPDVPLDTPNDAIMLIADTIRRVRAGELDIKTANCLGFLTDKLLNAYEVAKLNDKVELMERVLGDKMKK